MRCKHPCKKSISSTCWPILRSNSAIRPSDQRGFPFPDRKKARAAAAIAMQDKLRELEPDCRLPIPDGARALCTAAMKIVGLDTGAKLALKPEKGQLYCWRLA